MSHPQSADLPAEEVEEWQPHAPETFQEIGRIGQVAIGLFGLSTVTHLLTTWSDWHTYNVVNGFLGGKPGFEYPDLNRADMIARVTSIPNVVVCIAAAVIFVLWLWRARVNSEVFCQADHRHGHGWVLASWFCPGPNLWYPKQIVEDVWMASDERTPAWAGKLRPERRIPVITFWWGCWVGAMTFDVVVRRLLLWLDPTVGVLRGIAVSATVSLLLTGASAYFAMQLIRRITAMQTDRPWVSWWDQRAPAHLTAVPPYTGDADAPVAVPSLRIEHRPELQVAGAVGGEAPQWGSAPVNAPAANWSEQAGRLTAVPAASPLGGGSPLSPAAALGSGSPLEGPLGSPWPAPRAAEQEDEAPAWSPFAPVVETWKEPAADPLASTGFAAFTPDSHPPGSSSPVGDAAGFVPSPGGLETPMPGWSGGYRSSEDPLSSPLPSWQREQTQTPDWQTVSPPALSVVRPLPIATNYSTDYSTEAYSDYLAPSAPIPAPEEPVRRSGPGRRAAKVAVDSPSVLQRTSDPTNDLVQAPDVSGRPPAPEDDFLTPSKPLPPVPSFGPQPGYTPEPSYTPEPYSSSYSPEPTYTPEPTYNSSYGLDSYQSSESYSSPYTPEPIYTPESSYTTSYTTPYDYSPEPTLPVVDEPATAPVDEPSAEKPATSPRVHPRRRWS